ncbi:MAG: hypothetical protein JRG94_11280 [Deltaproteobacteria bacterium]|nr:hypothetical protein [Deltaproteobacteria bacterium]
MLEFAPTMLEAIELLKTAEAERTAVQNSVRADTDYDELNKEFDRVQMRIDVTENVLVDEVQHFDALCWLSSGGEPSSRPLSKELITKIAVWHNGLEDFFGQLKPAPE